MSFLQARLLKCGPRDFNALRYIQLNEVCIKLLSLYSCHLTRRHHVFMCLAHLSEEQLAAGEACVLMGGSVTRFLLGSTNNGDSKSKNKHLFLQRHSSNVQSIQLFFWRHVLSAPAVLERKMSTRQSREELIKKGVLKEVYEKGEKTNAINKMCHLKKEMWCWNIQLIKQNIWLFLNINEVF